MTQDPGKPTPLPRKYRVAGSVGAILGMAMGIAIYKLTDSQYYGLWMIGGGSLGIIVAQTIAKRMKSV